MTYQHINDKTIEFLKSEFETLTTMDFNIIFKFDESIPTDGYSVFQETISYSNNRGAIYGFYHYVSATYNLNFSKIGQITSGGRHLVENKVYAPDFKRRGNVLEVIDDIDYLKSLIKWMGYNGCNEIFFTFFLWDKVKDSLIEDLIIRDISVTLGGHSLKYLMGVEDMDPSSFSFLDNLKLIEVIKKSVAPYPMIKRLSLWPEDVGISEGDGNSFFNDYLTFTNALQEALPNILVEHIVYNAGLSWDMLLPPQISDLKANTNVLYAYWGRNYSLPIEASGPHQDKANDALVWWNQHQHKYGKELTVFEYYSDVFMMTEFYSPLANRIYEDIKWYKNQGVDAIVNLQVPLINGLCYDKVSKFYDYKYIHSYNNYVYIRALWGESIETIQKEWFSQFGDDANEVHTLVTQLEPLLSQFTKFNVPAFPKRYVDFNTKEMNEIIVSVLDLLNKTLDTKYQKVWHKDFENLRTVCLLYLEINA